MDLETLIPDCDLLYSCDLVLETREAGAEWVRKIEIGSGVSGSAYDRQYVCKLGKYDIEAENMDPSGWIEVTLKVGTTLGDLRTLAEELYGIASEELLIVKLSTHGGVEEFKGGDDEFLRDLPSRVYSNGTQIVARDRRLEGSESKIQALKDAVADDVDDAEVYFTDVEGSSYEHKITVARSLSHSKLTQHIADLLGKPSDEIKLYDGDRELYGYTLDKRLALKIKTAEKGGPSHQIPIHAFKGDRDCGEHLFDFAVQEDITVLSLKEQLAEKLREEKPDGAWGSCVGAHLRVREVGYAVFHDDQTVIEAVKNFAGGEKFAVSMIGGPETKTSATENVLTLLRWNPGTFSITENHLEVVAESTTKWEDLRRHVAVLIDPAAEDRHFLLSGVVEGSESAISAENIGLAKRGWRTGSIIDIPGLDWDPDSADTSKMDAYSRFDFFKNE